MMLTGNGIPVNFTPDQWAALKENTDVYTTANLMTACVAVMKCDRLSI